MERGYVKLWHKIKDSQSYNRRALHRALLMTFLVDANTRTNYFCGHEIKPGQLAVCVKSLSEDLHEPRTNVIRAIKDLVTDGTISVEKVDTRWSLITLVNWDTYQPSAKESGHEMDTTRTRGGRKADTLKELRIKNKEDSESKDSSSSTASDAAELVLKGKHKTIKGRRAEAFNRFWEAFSYKKDKAQAIDAWAALPPLTDAFVDRICDAAKQEAARRPDYEAKGRSPQYAQGWINGRRWEDEPDEPQVQLINVWRKRDA